MRSLPTSPLVPFTDEPFHRLRSIVVNANVWDMFHRSNIVEVFCMGEDVVRRLALEGEDVACAVSLSGLQRVRNRG